MTFYAAENAIQIRCIWKRSLLRHEITAVIAVLEIVLTEPGVH